MAAYTAPTHLCPLARTNFDNSHQTKTITICQASTCQDCSQAVLYYSLPFITYANLTLCSKTLNCAPRNTDHLPTHSLSLSLSAILNADPFHHRLSPEASRMSPQLQLKT